MRLMVIGGVATETKAAAKARRMDPKLEITIYQAEAETSTGECELPYLVSGTVKRREHLLVRTPEDCCAYALWSRMYAAYSMRG